MAARVKCSNSDLRRIRPDVYLLLEESGLPWSLEQGGQHKKVLLEGRLILILPNSGRKEEGRKGALRAALGEVQRAIRMARGGG